MKKLIIPILLISILFSCVRNKEDDNKVVEKVFKKGIYDDSLKCEKYYEGEGKDKKLVKEVLYYPNDQVCMQGKYTDEKREGYWVSYYSNGVKWSEGNFKNDKSDGKWTIYYENGKIRYEANYTNGEKSGIWKFYDLEGKIDTTINYDTLK